MPYNNVRSLVEGVGSLQMSSSSLSCVEYNSSVPAISHPPNPSSTKQYRWEGSLSGSRAIPTDHKLKTTNSASGSIISSKSSSKMAHSMIKKDGESSILNEGKKQFLSTGEEEDEMTESDIQKQQPLDDSENVITSDLQESLVFPSLPSEGAIDLLNANLPSKPGIGYCSSP